MAVVDLWLNNRAMLEDKHVQQIIAFAGSGKLLDGSSTSTEFRHYLDQIPSGILARYADECLRDSFKDSGLVLQDIINQVGKRLGFQVSDGRYRGNQSEIGADGVWRFPEGHSIVVEIKTTDAYRINLNTLAEYSKALVKAGHIQQDASSVLIVVGREDTGDLEAQIRGSRFTWLEGLNMTTKPNRFYWHIHIHDENGHFVLHRKKDWQRIDLTKYLIP